MFLSAVLQAHTDSLPAAEQELAPSHHPEVEEDTAALPDALTKNLKVPRAERLQPLPAAHRSRWV